MDSRRTWIRRLAVAAMVGLLVGVTGSTRPSWVPAVSAQAGAGPAQIRSAAYVGDADEDVLVSARTDSAGHLYLFARTETLPQSPDPTITIVPAATTPDPNFFCVVHKRSPDGLRIWSVYFEGFSLCEAMGVSPQGAVHLGMQSRASNFGGFAQLVTIRGDVAANLSIGPLNGVLAMIPGRPTAMKDIATDHAESVYVLYDQLVNADSELQARLIKVDQFGGVSAPVDIGLGFAVSAVAVAVDEFEQAFIVGSARSLDTTPDAFQPTRPTIFSCPDDGFLVQVDTRLNTLVYATYLGGTACDDVRDVAVAADGRLYVYGATTSEDFPIAGVPLHSTPFEGGPGIDGFILQMDLRQTGIDQLQFGTFLGLQLGDRNIGVRDAVDPLLVLPGGALGLTGTATASTFPLALPLFDATATTGLARFFQIYSPQLSSLLMSTHLDTSGAATHSVIALPPYLTPETLIPFSQVSLYAVTQTDEGGLAPPHVPPGDVDLLARRIDVAPAFGNLPPGVDLGPDRTVETTSTEVSFADACSPCSFFDLDGFLVSTSTRLDGGAPFELDENAFTLGTGRHVLSVIVTDDDGAVSSDSVVLDVVRRTAPALEILPVAPLTATSPAGVPTMIVASAIDPDDDPLTITWTGPFPTVTFDVAPPYNPVFRNATTTLTLPIGTSTVTLTATDVHGLVSTLTVQVEVSGINTPVGLGREVNQIDDLVAQVSGFTPGRMKFTYDNVTAPGLTYFRTRTDQVPPPPPGKQLGSSPFYYDVGTLNVASTGDIRVCIDTTAMSFANAPVLLHRLDGGVWTDVSSPPVGGEAAAQLVCGTVHATSELTTFALFTAANEAARVTTIVGNGGPFAPGHPAPGDGGPATAAPVGFPQTAAFDAPRNYLYVGDTNRLRRVDLATNTITTIAGTGDPEYAPPRFNENALLNWISVGSIAVDRAGNVFLNDTNGCGVLRVDAQTNILTRVAGRGPDPATFECGYTGDGGLALDADMADVGRLAFDADGNLFVSQIVFGAPGTGNGKTIRRIAAGADHLITGNDPGETISTVVGGGTQWFASDVHPRDVLLDVSGFAFAESGDLYIASVAEVVRVTPAPGRSAIDGDPGERLTIVAGQALVTYAPYQGDGGPARQANFSYAFDVAVLPNGDLAVVDTMTSRVRLVTTGGDGAVDGVGDERITTIAGFTANSFFPPPFNNDGYALSTAFSNPRGVVVDPRGGIVVSDSGFNRVRHVGTPGSIATGGGTDLTLGVSAAPDPVDTEATLTYNVEVHNNGPRDATNVTLSMSIAPGVEVIAPAPAGCTMPSAGQPGPLTCAFNGPLTATATWAFAIQVKPAQAGPLTTQFTVAAAVPDLAPADNAVSSTVTVNLAPRIIHIDEVIGVRDAAQIDPAIFLVMVENITLVDQPAPRPAAMLAITEQIVTREGVDLPDTLPPAVTPPASLVVDATEAAGARGNIVTSLNSRNLRDFLLGGSAVDNLDPTPTRLPPLLAGGIEANETTLFPVGVTTPVTFRFTDDAGNIGVAVANVSVANAIGGVISEPGTFVAATDSTGAPMPVSASFEALLQPGLLIANVLTIFPPLADVVPLSLVFDVRSTALVPPGAAIVVAISGDFPSDARMLHHDGTNWQDVTIDCGPGRLCGRVFSLSPFVVVRPAAAPDTTPPVVTPPAGITIPAMRATGTRASESLVLAAFLAGGSAIDTVDQDPVRLEPLVNGQPVSGTTVFPIGTTTVTFRFEDSAGNVGVATSTVTVSVGRPRVDVRLIGSGTVSGTRKYVDLELANAGDGHARAVQLDLLLPLPLQGLGLIKVVQPSVPLSVGNLDVGAAKRIRVVLDVPSRVKLLLLTAAGHFTNVKQQLGVFLEAHKVAP